MQKVNKEVGALKSEKAADINEVTEKIIKNGATGFVNCCRDCVIEL